MATAKEKSASKSAPKSDAAKPLVGVIGLGIMGSVMAQALLAAGYRVCGYDVVPAARKRLAQAGGQARASSTQVAGEADILIVSVSTAQALRDVTAQIAAAPRRPAGQRPVVVETSTLTLDDKAAARQVLAKAGLQVLDCPISGTAVRLKERAWTIFASGPQTALRRVREVLAVLSDNVPYVGAYGNGTKMKLAANHLVAIYNVATAESVNFARKMGLDPQRVLDLFGHSPVIGTGVMRLRMPFMIRREYEPATMKVQVWQKDMQVIGELARDVNCPTPLFTACHSIYTAAMAQGLAESDTASVSEVLATMAGVPPRRAKRAR